MSDTTTINLLVFFVAVAYVLGMFVGYWTWGRKS